MYSDRSVGVTSTQSNIKKTETRASWATSLNLKTPGFFKNKTHNGSHIFQDNKLY